MTTIKLSAAALTLSLLAAASFGTHAMAQQGGVEVGGNANNLTLVNRNTNAAIGKDATASTRIGSVHDSENCGTHNNLTQHNRNLHAAIAFSSFGSHAMATDSASEIGGNHNNLTLVNRNTNAAIGVNTTACSEIGNIGKSDACD